MEKEQSHLTLAITSELENLSQAIAADVSERVKAKKLLENIIKALGENNNDLVDQLLTKGISQLANAYPQAKPTLQKLQVDVNRHQEEQLRQTCNQLEEYCRIEGIPIKGSGTKYVVDTYIDVELDRLKGRTKIGVLSLITLKMASKFWKLLNQNEQDYGKGVLTHNFLEINWFEFIRN